MEYSDDFRNRLDATPSARNTRHMRFAEREPEGTGMTKVCRYCETVIEREGDRWVDVEPGGVYDFCTNRKFGEQEAGHRPI